jgi:Ku70/Ku80 beta-barrel domain
MKLGEVRGPVKSSGLGIRCSANDSRCGPLTTPRPLRPVTRVIVAGFDLVGFYSFGLVSIPVRLAVATGTKGLAFHLLQRKDGSRINQRYFCAADDEPQP